MIDIYCAALRLGVEVDGEIHFSPEAEAYDAERTKFLNSLNIHVVRFTNQEVLDDIQSVLKKLEEIVMKLRRD